MIKHIYIMIFHWDSLSMVTPRGLTAQSAFQDLQYIVILYLCEWKQHFLRGNDLGMVTMAGMLGYLLSRVIIIIFFFFRFILTWSSWLQEYMDSWCLEFELGTFLEELGPCAFGCHHNGLFWACSYVHLNVAPPFGPPPVADGREKLLLHSPAVECECREGSRVFLSVQVLSGESQKENTTVDTHTLLN